MKFSTLTEKQEKFLDDQVDAAFYFADDYFPDWQEDELTPEILDKIFIKWLEEPKDYSDQEIVSSIGAAFGTYLCNRLKMDWKVVEDEYGTALCVHHEKPAWTGYPFDSVQKRVDSKETNFLVTIFSTAKLAVE